MADQSSRAHKYGSFNYKVINKNLRDVLDVRSRLENNLQLAMPFVRATTTIKIPSAFNLGDGHVGFSLGVHSIEDDMGYEAMYASSENQMPLIGHTYNNGAVRPVYAIDPLASVTANLFDRRTILYKNVDNNYTTIAPPGITNLTVGRNKNGVIHSADLTISVPSLVQLESLHRCFLVPGVGMVIEWGQNFAGRLNNSSYKTFPWKDSTERDVLFKRLGAHEVGMEEILTDYAYPSNGQYMWLFGRVGNFSINTNNDGSFVCKVKIIGPSESSFAYNVITTAIPAKDASTSFFCASKTNSIYTYLTNTTAGGFNFKNTLDTFRNKSASDEWKYHVWYAAQGNKKDGSLEGEDEKPNQSTDSRADLNSKQFQDSDDAYFITWRFFVNVILNSEEYGFMKIFKDASLTDEERRKIALLLPFADGERREDKSIGQLGKKYINDPLEMYVGYNKFLRSVDLSTCFIVNEEAVKLAQQSGQYKLEGMEEFLQPIPDADVPYIFSTGEFGKTTGEQSLVDKGLLSSGVWINHKAIVESFINADTILRGISNLLDKMSRATLNYWKLTVDVAEPILLGDAGVKTAEPYNFTVIDANFKENISNAIEDFIDNVHVFNKYLRTDIGTGKLMGSELLECSIDLSLPKRLYAQIGTIGLSQPEDRAKLNLLGSGDETIPPNFDMGPKLADPNDTLREMFSILILDPKDDNAQGPDLTIPPKTQRKQLILENLACGSSNAQVTGQAGGQGNQTANVDLTNVKTDDPSVKKNKDDLKRLDEYCKKCEECAAKEAGSGTVSSTTNFLPGDSKYTPPVHDIGGSGHKGIRNDGAQYSNGRLPESLFKPIGGGYKLRAEAADAFIKLREAYQRSNPGKTLRVTSAYRSFDAQVETKRKYGEGAAEPGYSAHGWGAAVDFGDLHAETAKVARSLGTQNVRARPNAIVRANSELYNWLALNAPQFGWYNPSRLIKPIDFVGKGIAETWHWEYYGDRTGVTNSPVIRTPVPRGTPQQTSTSGTSSPAAASPATTSNRWGAVFVSGLTRDISKDAQIAAFRQGVGPNKRIFTAEYTQIAQVKEFLAQHPRTPVFLYSKAVEFVGELINDPNIDKQKLFLIEPFFGEGTRASVVNAIRSGVPASNLYSGPTSNRGAGIPGASLTPGNINHNQAPTYVGQQKASILPSAGTTAPPQQAPTSAGQQPTGPQATEQPTRNAANICYVIVGNKDNPPTLYEMQPFKDGYAPKPVETQLDIDLKKQASASPRDRGKIICDYCSKLKMSVNQVAIQTQVAAEAKNAANIAKRQFKHLGKIFRYLEVLKEYMVASIAADSNGINSNAYGTAPGSLSIGGDLVLPGVSGFRIGELFWIERIPAFYRVFGAFQVLSIEDVVDVNGWKTKVHARFTYLGIGWQRAMAKKLLSNEFVQPQGFDNSNEDFD